MHIPLTGGHPKLLGLMGVGQTEGVEAAVRWAGKAKGRGRCVPETSLMNAHVLGRHSGEPHTAVSALLAGTQETWGA